MEHSSVKDWIRNVVKPEENYRYLQDGKDFIDDEAITNALKNNRKPTKKKSGQLFKNL